MQYPLALKSKWRTLQNCSKFRSQNVQTYGYVFHDITGQTSWSNIEDPVIPLERHFYGHHLQASCGKDKFEKVFLELGWGKSTALGVPLDVNVRKKLYANIVVLSSGTKMVLGGVERMTKELMVLAPSGMKIKVVTSPDNNIPTVGTKRFRCAEVSLAGWR